MRQIEIVILILVFQITAFSQSPVTDFNYAITKINCDFISANFNYTSYTSDDVDSCCWDFGDGVHKCRSSNAASHNYSQHGIYSVKLTLWKDGIESNIVKKDLITVYVPPEPNFNFVLQDSLIYAPVSVEFDNNTIMGDCQDLTYAWDFGNGDYSSEKNPIYLFNSPNTYFVTLNVTDTLGCDKNYRDYIIVKDTAQKEGFLYIVSSCNENTPCDWVKVHILESNNFLLNLPFQRNDSIILSGIIQQNCCTEKTVTLNEINDTVYIKTWEAGPQCTCSDNFYFEISLPSVNKDTLAISFNGMVVTSVVTTIPILETKIQELILFPNPVKDILILKIEDILTSDIDYEILDINGKTLQYGKLHGQNQIKLTGINKGMHLIHIKNRSINIEYVSRFVKI